MPATSAGLLMYRRTPAGPQVLLVHPGGPFWKNKDNGAWSVPKGEVGQAEDLLEAARREFREELGCEPVGNFTPLPPINQKGGKIVHVWCFEGDFDPQTLRSNTFEMEWPPKSGQRASFPEVDGAAWFDLNQARGKILISQAPLLDSLTQVIGAI